MNCPSCGQLNQETAKFCSECATPLRPVGVCAACGHENTRSSKFCSECAAPLAPATPHPVSSAPTPTPAPSSAPSPALPSSFADGRYTVKGFLGEGGRKRVYLAHDTKLDRDVAVAVIKTEGLDGGGLLRGAGGGEGEGGPGGYPPPVGGDDVGRGGRQ